MSTDIKPFKNYYTRGDAYFLIKVNLQGSFELHNNRGCLTQVKNFLYLNWANYLLRSMEKLKCRG